MAYFAIPKNPKITETPDFSERPYVAGLEMAVTSLTTATFQPGCGRSVQNPENIQYPPINATGPGVITLDVSTVFVPSNQLDANGQPITGTPIGFGGCFPLPLSQAGLAGNDTMFPVLLIGDSSGKNFATVIIPTSGAFLPAGYDSFVRVGLMYIDGSTFNIIPMEQSGHYERREYILANSVQVLTAGAATVATLVDLTANDGPILPGIALVKFNAIYTPAANTDNVSLTATGLTSTSYPVYLQSPAAAAMGVQIEMVPGVDTGTGHAGVDYINSAAAGSLSLFVSGFTDCMAVQIN